MSRTQLRGKKIFFSFYSSEVGHKLTAKQREKDTDDLLSFREIKYINHVNDDYHFTALYSFDYTKYTHF